MLPDVLQRIRRTRSQTSLQAGDRLRNVARVFRIRRRVVEREALLQARHLLLVDDTFTTGSTLAACYLTLRAVLGPDVRISVATLSVVED